MGRYLPKWKHKKWNYVGDIKVYHPYLDYLMEEKPAFEMTKPYKRYLHKVETYKRFEVVSDIYEKLDYQFYNYGEVDQIDYEEYLYRVKQFYYIFYMDADYLTLDEYNYLKNHIYLKGEEKFGKQFER